MLTSSMLVEGVGATDGRSAVLASSILVEGVGATNGASALGDIVVVEVSG